MAQTMKREKMTGTDVARIAKALYDAGVRAATNGQPITSLSPLVSKWRAKAWRDGWEAGNKIIWEPLSTHNGGKAWLIKQGPYRALAYVEKLPDTKTMERPYVVYRAKVNAALNAFDYDMTVRAAYVFGPKPKVKVLAKVLEICKPVTLAIPVTN